MTPKGQKQAKFLDDMKAPPAAPEAPTPEEVDTMTATETAAPIADLSMISDAELEAELAKRKGSAQQPAATAPAAPAAPAMPVM